MMILKAFLATGSILAITFSQPALAQAAAPAAPADQTLKPASPDAGQTTNPLDIIVTAQRREQNVMSVPLSIQTYSGDTLAKSGIRDLTSLQFNTTGYLPGNNNGFTQVYIRGVGNNIFTGSDPSVATFIDDVPQVYAAQIDNLVDVERIEVLKGAQGGLYGRNSTGGAINIITRRPSTTEIEADGRVSYGEHNSVEAAGHFNLPLSSTVAISVTGYRQSHDAYIKNLAPAAPYSAANFPEGSAFGTPAATAAFFNSNQAVPQLDTGNVYAFGGKLLFKPTNNFSYLISGAYSKKDDTNGGQFVNATPAYTNAVFPSLFASFGINAVFPPGFVNSGSGKFTSSIGFATDIRIRDYNFSGTGKLTTSLFDFTEISSYRNQKTYGIVDGITSTVTGVPITIANQRQLIYQELRAVSNFAGPLQLIMGATYLNSQTTGHTQVYFLNTAFQIGNTLFKQTVDNFSIYAQAAYNFTDRLNLTVSGRYTDERNQVLFTQPTDSTALVKTGKFIPSATLNYKLGNGGVLYARWAQGFKTGGINTGTAPAFFPKPTDGSVFGPERVDTYETGFKATALDRRLLLTGAVFYNDYRNIQVDARPLPEFVAITTAVVNAQSARTYGVEGSANWSLSKVLTVGVNAGYLNAKYKRFTLTGSTVLSDFNRDGQQMIKAPKLQASANVDIDQPINDHFDLVGHVLVSHTSSVIFNYSAVPGVLPNSNAPGYWIVNGRIGVKTADSKYSINLVGDNIFNRVYYVESNSSSFGNVLNYGQPRVIRGEITAKF